MAHIRMSRAGRKAAIESAMIKSAYPIQTVNSIARMVGVAPSSYLRSLIHEMVNDEILAVKEIWGDSDNVVKRYYSLDYRIPDSTSFYQYELPI